MNARLDNASLDNGSFAGGSVATRPVHPTHRFKLLLLREFWEHKGGFFWAPLVASGISLLFLLIGAVGGSIFKARHANEIHIDGDSAGEIARALGSTGDVALLGGIGLTLVVLGFVVFFYSLSALYDDRRDRSVLFWKSLPISDASTVGSKVVWALVLGPIIAIGIGLVLGLATWVLVAATTTVNGLPGASGILTNSHPIRVIASVIGLVPLYSLWALPSVGWLMLCSAAARSKPFLWAVMIPVLGSALVSFANFVLGLGLDVTRLWYVAYRSIFSVFPATWARHMNLSVGHVHGPEDIANIVGFANSWSVIATADLWIGVIAGAAMIFGAIRMRRYRDEG